MDWLIMQCISTPMSKVIVNRKIGSSFVPESDIRQGHSLSPYIFIIFVEYLGRYIHFLTSQQRSSVGTRLDKDTHNISYLMFVDDCIIFCRTTTSAARNITQLLDHYCTASGQLVNYDKSRIQFSKSMLNTDKKEISHNLQILITNTIGTYLGCVNID